VELLVDLLSGIYIADHSSEACPSCREEDANNLWEEQEVKQLRTALDLARKNRDQWCSAWRQMKEKNNELREEVDCDNQIHENNSKAIIYLLDKINEAVIEARRYLQSG
jgi:hypothetical protein